MAYPTEKKRPDGHYDGAPVGTIAIRDGVIVVEALAERWEHVNVDLTLANHELVLPRLELLGRSGGRVKVEGVATFDGFLPNTLHLTLDTERAPFAQRGIKVGSVTGRTEVDAKLVPLADGRDRLVIDITLDRLSIDLAPAAEGQVQVLDEDRSIVTRQALGHRVAPPGAPGVGTAVMMSIHVREPVLVRRSDVHIAVIGDPKIEIDASANLGGELRVVGDATSPLIQPSWVEVVGKRFYLHESNVALEGRDDFDPVINVDARWQAPDRTIVQVLVTGRLRSPRIAFHALDRNGAPLALTRGQIMSLLAIGRPDPGSLLIQEAAEKGAALLAASVVSDVTTALFGKELQKWLPSPLRVPFAPATDVGEHHLENLYFEIACSVARR